MKWSDRIDAFLRLHPKLFLAAMLLLVALVVVVMKLAGTTGSRLVYQAF